MLGSRRGGRLGVGGRVVCTYSGIRNEGVCFVPHLWQQVCDGIGTDTSVGATVGTMSVLAVPSR